MKKLYELPKLNYDFKDLAPHISEEQLKIHYEKHHSAYVKAANAILEKLDKARQDKIDLDYKAEVKALSFNIGGHILHSLFWENLSPVIGGKPTDKILQTINEEFGSFERFKDEFTKTALAVEGSGWVALTASPDTKQLLIMQIEKHNVNLYPTFNILLIVDMFEHAYYVDYQNEKAKYLEAIWNIINWQTVENRL